MKENYSHPAMELLHISVEDGACATVSGTEQFNIQQGEWNVPTSNF